MDKPCNECLFTCSNFGYLLVACRFLVTLHLSQAGQIMKLWVDDIRMAPDESWSTARNSKCAISMLSIAKEQGDVIEIMSLDHDLGGDDTTRPVVLWCCENDWWPDEVVVHSANYVGVEWLEGMIERYHPSNAHKYIQQERLN